MNITNHVNKIVEEYRFEVRSKKNPNECPCYTSKPCHDMPDLNCFLCYCPNYDTEKIIGGCKINHPNGKWHYNELLPEKKIFDCSDCTYPHSEIIIKKYLNELFNNKKTLPEEGKKNEI